MPLPTDPLLSQQWHLGNTGGLLDLNVRAAWNPASGRAYTGSGTRTVVIDNGFDYNHSDLAPNYDTFLDYDFENNTLDPFGATTESHGTAVAGIIGADNNGTGAVGVAFNTSLVGYRTRNLISNDWLTDISEAIHHAALSAQGDVANISQGIANDEDSEFGAGYEMARFDAIRTSIGEAVDQGRGGLGMTIVKSAGNSRADDYDVNADRWSNDTRQVVVAAVDQNGFVSSYSSYGAAVLVSGFGTPGQVVTTDRVGAAGYNNTDFTSGFNGTSAAAPMVTGVVSLMYEANGSLGWRDVQSILANSARHVGSAVDGVSLAGSERYAWNWNGADTWNGGGMHFSNDYGYGLVDAWAATRLAETWLIGNTAQTTSNQFSNTMDMLNGATVIVADGNASGHTFTGTASFSDIVDRVTVTITFSTTWLADLDLYITSPDGTTSRLINDNASSADFNGTWTFETQAFRGERADGTWSVRAVDDAGGDALSISDVVVRTYGAWTSNDRYVYTNEFSNYAGVGGHSTVLSDTNGGSDTINAAAVSSASLINLNSGATSIIDGVAMTIAGGTTIENAIGGDFADILIGNSVGNLLYGGRSSDSIDGGAGIDTSIYTGARSQYNVVRLSTGEIRVDDLRINDADGADRVRNVENFQFTNGTKTLAQLTDITDFNLFLTNSSTHQIRDWIFTNGAVSANQSYGAPPASWKILATGDFNMDGIGDALLRDSTTGLIREWLLDGSGGLLGNVSLGNLASNWRVIGTGDFDGNGQSDILWQNQSTGELRDWSMSNGAIAGNTVLGALSSEWRVVGTTDATGDGTYDIFWRNTSTGEARLWQMSNGTVASQTSYGVLASSWGIAATGDFNHDGTGDAVWRNVSTGETRIWTMSNGNIAGTTSLGTVGTSWKVIGAGDYTQDGHDDLMWLNTSTGDTRIWDIVSNSVTNNIVVGNTPAGWNAAVNAATHSDFLGLI